MRGGPLDHVAVWTDQRDAMADFLCNEAGMHVIERTDRFTLVGVDARKGKLTLFDADGPREAGALAHVGLRVRSPREPVAAPGGLELRFVENGGRAGGSMLLSSGVIWRYRDWDEFRRQCPDGDEVLQRVVHEGVDEAIAWLESLGAPVVEASTGNPLTVGKRFDPAGLVEALVRRVPRIQLRS